MKKDPPPGVFPAEVGGWFPTPRWGVFDTLPEWNIEGMDVERDEPRLWFQMILYFHPHFPGGNDPI